MVNPKEIMNISKKTQYTVFVVLLSSVISTFLSKNHLDVISVPLVLVVSSLLISVLTLILPSRRTKEEFHKQFNYTYTVLCVISVLIYLINN